MKVTTLKIHNIGLIADTEIKLDKPLILFYGEIRQGKTTILNAVRWVCGGAFPSDIIRHGEKEAFVELGFDGGVIRREWYVSQKDKSTKAREVQFVRNGKPVASPVGEIKRFLNPFLLDQDFFRNKSELERKQYFTELFAVDTSALDTELFNAEREAVGLRAKIKGYGEIDLKEVKTVDTTTLRSELEAINKAHEAAMDAWTEQNTKDAELTVSIKQARQNILDADSDIARLEKELASARELKTSSEAWLKEYPDPKSQPKPAKPDTSALEARISDAAANQVRVEQYAANKKRAEAKADDEKKLAALELRGREIKKEKTAKLKDVSDTCGIEGLAFDDDGSFTFQGTSAGMLSTSQIIKLSSSIEALYPPGFGIELLDRGESLGRSVFDYVKHADANKLTVMATVVGQKPSTVPERIGVFIVKDGIVFPAE